MTFRKDKGFSLVEVMVAMTVAVVVIAIALNAYVALQNGLSFSSNWNTIRVSQQRALDSMALDLRNASQISLPSGSAPTASGTDASCVIPLRYSAYKYSGAFAGDPAVAISGTFLVSPQTGKELIISGTVNYVRRPTGYNNEVEIVREFLWNDATGSHTAQRQVSTFSNGVGITYTFMKSGTAVGNSTVAVSGSTDSIVLTATAGVFLRNRASTPVTTTETVYLREFCL